MPLLPLPPSVALLLSLEAGGAGVGARKTGEPVPRRPLVPAAAEEGGHEPAKLKPAPDSAPPSQRFEEGKIAFARGQYKRAIEVLRPLTRPEVLLESETDLVAAHRMLGVALLFENQPGAAREEFRQLLELRPESRFDPLLDPPFIVDFFNNVLREQQAEIKRLEQLRERSSKSTTSPGSGRSLLAVRGSPYVSWIPFGAGQFQNGERAKGWSFLVAESSFAAISVGAFVTNFALFGIHPRRGCKVAPTSPTAPPSGCPPEAIDHSDEALSRNLTRLQVGAGALFFATAIWGVVDAVRGYREISFEPEPPPKSAGKNEHDLASRSSPTSWQIGFSVMGPPAAGLSLRF